MPKRSAWMLLALPLLMNACASTGTTTSPEDYRLQFRKLQERLVNNPQDAEALRDLGVVYFETRQYGQAREYLKKAWIANEHDGKTMLYLGLTQEYDKDLRGALATYLNYSDIASSSPYRKLVEGRYNIITRQMIAQQFRDLAQDEQGLAKQNTPSNAVAVFPLTYDGSDEKFSALGLGLAEMMTTDLGQVKALRLVERLRVDELMNELKFSASSAVDPSSAPRMGKFLSAGKIIGGRYSINAENNLRVDIASLDIARDSLPKSTTDNDALENLFKLQKDVVFKLIKDMGITLTRAEIDAIQRVPTKNLQAFLAYSKGLEKEGQGDFEAAGVYFRQAGALDPQFTPAKTKAEAADAVAASGPSKESTLAAADQISPPPAPDSDRQRRGDKQHLLTQRLSKLSKLIGLGFMPGIDSRKAAQIASEAGAVFGSIPDPPPPPPVP